MRQYCGQISMMHRVLQSPGDVDQLVAYEKSAQGKLVELFKLEEMEHSKKELFEIEFGRQFREAKAKLDGNL